MACEWEREDWLGEDACEEVRDREDDGFRRRVVRDGLTGTSLSSDRVTAGGDREDLLGKDQPASGELRKHGHEG